MPDLGSTEMTMLWLSIVLGLLQIAASATMGTSARGMPWALGPRDEPGAPVGKAGGRVERAWRNFIETFPIFAAAVLMSAVLNKHSSMSALGAQLYFWARLVYVPVYIAGVPIVRTLVWAASIVGIVLVLLTSYPGFAT